MPAQNLMTLEGKLAQDYQDLLERRLRLSLPERLAALQIDRQGKSPQVAQLIGNPYYLGRRFIIADIEQYSADIIEPELSVTENVLELFFTEYKELTSRVCARKPLCGEIDFYENISADRHDGHNALSVSDAIDLFYLVDCFLNEQNLDDNTIKGFKEYAKGAKTDDQLRLALKRLVSDFDSAVSNFISERPKLADGVIGLERKTNPRTATNEPAANDQAKLSRSLNYSITIDTLDNDISRMEGVKGMIEAIRASPRLVFDMEHRANMKRAYVPLFSAFGNISGLHLESRVSEHASENILKYSTRNFEVYFLKRLPNVNEKDQTISNSGFDTIFFEKSHPLPDALIPRISDMVPIAKGAYVSRIIDLLFSYNGVSYDLNQGERRMDEMEEDILIKYGNKLVREAVERFACLFNISVDESREMLENMEDVNAHGAHTIEDFPALKERLGETRYDFLKNFEEICDQSDKGTQFINKQFSRFQRYRTFQANNDLVKSLDPNWDLLKKVIYNNAGIDVLPLNLKLPFMRINSEDPSIYEIVARINPDDYIFAQRHDPNGFIRRYNERYDADTRALVKSRILRLPAEEINPMVYELLR